MSKAGVDASIRVIDSHTGGEPTRVVVEGGPDLGRGDMRSRRDALASKFDWLRTALLTEPRGSEWMVGAALQPPVSESAAAGVVFFNNVGYLGMCGHGMIGVVATLATLQQISSGVHLIETPVGDVTVELDAGGAVTVENIRCYRTRTGVRITAPGYGEIFGDVAWGGNWFFLAKSPAPLVFDAIEELTFLARSILSALHEHGITGDDGAKIDHVELFGPPADPATADSRNFVLCPGGHYDRSPCGTGVSAKVACLAADGQLAPNAAWRQESIVGSVFTATYRPADDAPGVIPKITGRAHVTGDLRLLIDPTDPFRFGIPPESADHE